MAGDMPAGLRSYAQAVALFEALDDQRGLASGLSVMGTLSANNVMDTAAVAPLTLLQSATHVARALDIARRIGYLAGEAYALIILSCDQSAMGQAALALDQTRRALEIAAAIEHRLWLTYGHQVRGLAYRDILALPQARRELEQGLALARELNSPFWTGMGAAFLATVLIQQGALAEAEALLQPSHTRPLLTLADKLLSAARLELALARGDHEQGEAELDRLLAAVLPPPDADAPVWQTAPRLLLLHGQLLAAQQRWPEAMAILERALSAAQAQGARALEWRVLAALGRALRAQRLFDQSDAAFDAARSLIESLTLEVPDGELRASFRQAALGQLPPPRLAARRRALKREFGGLTPREREIAALVGQARSNRDIAAALVLSERTVEKHVSNILAKLALDNRVQLVAWAAGRSFDAARAEADH
jgi:DNA-binding NarL/FixJ family response regulator